MYTRYLLILASDEANIPGIISAMNARPGAANNSATAQCQPHTSIAPKKAPIVIGRVNLSINASIMAAIAQPEPK